MTGPFITQCPNCGTAFEVSERELSMADGIVRCGQCRHVFTATDFPVSADASSQSSNDDDTPDFARHDDVDIEDISANLRFTVREAPEEKDIEVPDDALFDDDTGEEEIKEQIAESRQMKFSDAFLTSEQNTGNAFANEREDKDETAIPVPAAATDDAVASDEADSDEGDSSEFDDVRPFILDDADDEDFAEAEAAASTPLDDSTQPSMPAVQLDDEETPTRDDLPVVTVDDLDDTFSALDGGSPVQARHDEDVVMAEPMSSKLQRIGGAPVEMPVYDTRSIFRRDGVWLAAACIAMLALLVQYTTYRFDTLAHDARYRGLLGVACKVAGCTLPAETNLQALQASNLIIRSHSSLQNALAVDFVLSNDASFAQAFPKLLLQFSDVNGQAIAQRILAPEDYLAGEMAGAHQLKARQSVHVALEIADPGPTAISYALQPIE
ncbi:MAG: DUF3426 domain-containing protein [Gammaproteobacteria bacterium]|nr:MAG: DUF3426 domain-containing protein [Gammaproteobacteria bacterium]